MTPMLDHLRHMANVRPHGLDRDAAQWAIDEIERLKAERLKLDRRIHNQRRALRDTWEIVEMRRKWLGSETARRMYAALLKRYQALRARTVADA